MQRLTHAWFVGGILLWSLVSIGSTQAQIVPDATLPQNSSVTPQDNINIITGGTVAGANLFHSFGQFSLPVGGVAYFNNALEIQNIISRVTGSSISKIDGLIQANGTANLFLLNSKGVIFGPNASLDIGGSFLASTATSLNFADNTQFSVTAAQPSSLLTISVPIGLQFGETVGNILNQSQAVNGGSSGLQVQPGRTLALVGGNIRLDGGTLRAPDGRIELGGISGAGVAGLSVDGNNLSLSFPSDVARGDVSLNNNSLVDASGESGGDIRVQARRISLTDGSQIIIETLGSEAKGSLAVNASESIVLAEESGLLTGAVDTGGIGSNLTITTGELTVQDSAISTNAVLTGEGELQRQVIGRGEAGNLFVSATELVELIGTSADSQVPSGLFTGALGNNDAGSLLIETGQLMVQDGAQVNASTSGNGSGGNLVVIATESVALAGSSADGQFLSGLSTQAEGNGNAGALKIETGQLMVQDGAQVGASALGNGSGGDLTVVAELVELTGSTADGQLPSSLLTQAEGAGKAGNLKITTGQLIIQDKAEVAVSSQGLGDAGNVSVTAGSIQLGNQAAISAQSKLAKGGNITLQAQNLLLLRDKSLISTEAGGTRSDGNINISANVILAVPSENSDIIATSAGSGGGNIQINTKGLIGPQFSEQPTSESDIVATGKISAKSVVTDVRPFETLPAKVVDTTKLVVQDCQGSRGAPNRGVSKFTNTGRGGLPPTPSEVLRGSSPLVDLGSLSQDQGDRSARATNAIDSEPAPVVEAQGWIIGDTGEVVLTAQAQTGTPYSPWLTSAACTASTSS